MAESDPLTSLDQVVAAAGDASLDDFLDSLYCDLELDIHFGIEESDHEAGLIIKTAPMYESMSSDPEWIRKTLVRYPTTLTEIYAIVRRLDAEQIQEWEDEGDLGDRLGELCSCPRNDLDAG